jgi:hypothetical protein
MELNGKKYVYIGCILATIVLMSNSGGSPGGKTGSSGDKKVSCATNGGCHGPKTPETQEMISTTIPESGYVLGAEYTVTISAMQAGKSRFGFELVAEDSTGVAKGTFVTNSEVNASGNRATHRFQGTGGVGEKSWDIVWKAPETASGDLTFYTAVLAANNNGTTSGDEVLLDNFKVKQSANAAVAGILKEPIRIYPNPTVEVLYIDYSTEMDAVLSITNSMGKVVQSQNFKKVVSVEHLPAGNYFLKLEIDNVVIVKAFIKR